MEWPRSMPKTLKRALAASLFVALEIALVLFVDRPTTAAVRRLEVSAPDIIAVFKAITDVGKSFWYLYPSAAGIALCLALSRLPKIGYRARVAAWASDIGGKFALFFAIIAGSGLLTDGLKWVLGRARPVLDLQAQIYGFSMFSGEPRWNSMPSGHATTSIALAVCLCLLWPQGRALWLVLGGVLAASRVMVCAHYLSDILAGGMVAAVVANQFLHLTRSHGILPCIRRLFPIDKPAETGSKKDK